MWMPMIIRRVRHEGHFTAIDNRCLRDARLSYRARGLLAYALSLPTDASLRSEDLASGAPDGRDGVRSSLGELEGAGYLLRERVQGDAGRYRTVATLYECPEDAQAEALPLVAPKTDSQASVTDPSSVSAGRTEDGFTGVGNPTPGKPTPVKPSSSTRRTRSEDPSGADTAAPLVAHFVDTSTAIGVEPTRSMRSRIGREIRTLLREGKRIDLIREAVEHVAENVKTPQSLPYVVADLEKKTHALREGS